MMITSSAKRKTQQQHDRAMKSGTSTQKIKEETQAQNCNRSHTNTEKHQHTGQETALQERFFVVLGAETREEFGGCSPLGPVLGGHLLILDYLLVPRRLHRRPLLLRRLVDRRHLVPHLLRVLRLLPLQLLLQFMEYIVSHSVQEATAIAATMNYYLFDKKRYMKIQTSCVRSFASIAAFLVFSHESMDDIFF